MSGRSRILLVGASLVVLAAVAAGWWLVRGFGPRVLAMHPVDGRTFVAINPEFGRQLTGHAGAPLPPPLWISLQKEASVRRVLLLGGRAGGGVPMADYHLGRVLQAVWAERFPSEPIEVINLSLEGAGPAVLRELARQGMVLQPDLVVVCVEATGLSPLLEDPRWGLPLARRFWTPEDATLPPWPTAGKDGELTAPGADAVRGAWRGIVEAAARIGAPVLFVRMADGPANGPGGTELLSSAVREVAVGSGVAFVDAGISAEASRLGVGGGPALFLSPGVPSFPGRVVLAGKIADAMASLGGTGSKQANNAPADAEQTAPPAGVEEVARTLMFNGYDEHDMWSWAWRSARSGDEDGRVAALGAAVEALRRRAVLDWDTTELIVAYERAVLQNPHDPVTHFTAARLLGARGEGVRAVDAFAEGFALMPHHAEGRLNHAAMQMARGDLDSARVSLSVLQNHNPHAAGFTRLKSAMALQEGDLAGAVNLLERHLAESPSDVAAWQMLAEVQMRLGQHEDSERSLEQARTAGEP